MSRYVLFLIVVSLGVAVTAFAGSRAKDSAGAVPSAATDGVALGDSEGCRLSVRTTDGGTINGGTLAVYYYDSVLGWVRSATSLDCVLESNKLIDGGAPQAQVCPDLGILARYGRIGVAAKALVGADGGTVTAITRVECYGAQIP